MSGPRSDSLVFDGGKLATWRVKAGYESQEDLALALGYTRTVVTHVEKGRIQPSPRFIGMLDNLLEKLHTRSGRPGAAPVSRDLFYVRRRP